jgi:hypothetical protein
MNFRVWLAYGQTRERSRWAGHHPFTRLHRLHRVLLHRILQLWGCPTPNHPQATQELACRRSQGVSHGSAGHAATAPSDTATCSPHAAHTRRFMRSRMQAATDAHGLGARACAAEQGAIDLPSPGPPRHQ